MASGCQSDIGADTSRSLEACRIVDRRLEAERGNRADTRHGHKPADLHIATRQRQNLTVEIADLLLDGLARDKQWPDRGNRGRFRGFTGSLPLQPARLLAPLYGSDWNAQPSGTFTSRLSTDRSPSPLLDITTTATGLLVWGFFCQEVSAEWRIFLPSSASLFDLKARFFVSDPKPVARRSCQGCASSATTRRAWP